MKKLRHFLLPTSVLAMFLVFSLGVVQAGTCELPFFDNSNFGTRADNPYLSTDSIGYTYVYEAETDEGLVRDFQYFYIPSPAKTILGVDVIEVYDVEYLYVEDLREWVILEKTWDWHDWDKFGNFWYFGEDTLAYEWNDDWSCYTTSTAGSWEADVDFAEPGIILPTDPKPGDCVLQEFYEDKAEDRGKVLRLNGNASDWCDKDCLVTKEWTKLDPGNVEHKFYRPDSGIPGEVSGLVYIEELKEQTVIFELVDHYFGPPNLTEMDIYPLPSPCP